MTYESAVLSRSPAFFYKMDEASGSTCVDYGTLGVDGAYGGTVTYAQGALYGAGDSVKYLASNSAYMQVITTAPLSWPGMTACGWCKPMSSDDPFLLSLEYDGARVPFAIGHGGVNGVAGKFNGGYYNSGWNVYQSTTSVVSGVTYFVAMSIASSGSIKLYVDGALETTASVGGTGIGSWGGGKIYVGKRWDGNSPSHKDGQMSGWAVFDSVLSDSDIADIYNGIDYVPPPPPPPTRPRVVNLAANFSSRW